MNFFDSQADFQVHRRKLPHWTQTGVIYFVTFRLADSLPVQKLAALEEEKKRWLAVNPPPHKESQIQEYHRNFSQRILEWLDAGYGSCVLAQPEIFCLVESALTFFHEQRYLLGEHVVMPNHVHALVKPLGDHDLNRILHSWKSFSAHRINRITGLRGRVWHRESFDHIVRNADQLARIERYIRDNPKALPINRHPHTQ